MPFPTVPRFPDNDPVEALRMLRDYVRLLLDYFSPLTIGVGLLAVATLGSVAIYFVANLDLLISWGAEFVPVAFALVGIIFSVKKLREEHHFAVISLLVIVGVLGTVVLHMSRTRVEAAHEREIGGLRERMDSWQTQNSQLLTSLLKPLPLNAQGAELERRQNIEKVLRGEYILSHDNVSPGLIAGIEFPPPDWMNKRLQELGEKWKVAQKTIPASSASAPSLPPPPAVDVTVLTGDDEAEHTSFSFDPTKPARWNERERACKLPFKCYPERDLKDKAIDLDVGTKGWARMFFAVYDVGGSNIIHPTILVNLGRAKDVLVTRINQRQPVTPGARTDSVVQFSPSETMDMVPFSKSESAYEYAADFTVGPLVTNFSATFRIYGDNLPNHFVFVPVNVKHGIGEK